MNNEINIKPLIIMWIAVLFIILNTRFSSLNRKLDRIENNTKEIIEILRNGDV